MHRSCLLSLLVLGLILAAGTGLGAPGQPEAPKKDPDHPDKAADLKPGVRLTVYNDNFALVKDRRELPDELKKGLNVVRFTDVAATLDPTSVHFRSLTDPDATVAEQDYEFDLVNADKLLQKYI